MRAAIAIALPVVAVLATGARADSFEARAQDALRISDPADLVWALTATCEAGTDVQQRQCRIVRDRKAAAIEGRTLLLDAEPAAFDLGPWNASRKSVPMTLSACVRCDGIEVDGHTWYVTGPRPQMVAGKLRGAMLYDNSRLVPDANQAAAWKASIGKHRTQLIAKLSRKNKFSIAGRDGFALDVIAWRVYSACDGKVVVSSVSSGPGAIDSKACPKPAAAPSASPP